MRYRVEKIPKGIGFDVFFSFCLKGVAELVGGETLAVAVRRADQIVRALFIPALDCGFELLAYNPGPGIGPMSLTLRARVSSLTEAEAMEKARATAAALSVVLNIGNRWHWVPAEAEGADLFPSLPAGSSLYSIARRASLTERTASVDLSPDFSANSPEQKARSGAAVNRGAMYMTVDPFLPQPDPLGRILRLLSASECASLVSIAISPVGLYDSEAQLMAPAETNSVEESIEEEWSETAWRGKSLKESAFMLRVAFLCAAQGTQAALLAQGVGASLSASIDRYMRAGGFEARRIDEQEVAVALAELKRIAFPPKPPSPGRPGWERLPALVSSWEAGMVFRFPASPCPGVPQRRPMAALTGLPAATGTLVGTASGGGGGPVDVRITQEDRLRHVYIVGQTGTGKSSLMLSMVLQDIAEGHGVCLMDPHGDLYSRVLASVPASRRKDIIAFDCAQAEPGYSFSLLEHSSEAERDRVVEHFLEIFNQLFDLKIAGGPIFEMYFRSALTLVMCDPQATLADFMKFFQDNEYRRYCIGLCKDEFVSGAWKGIVAVAGGEMSLNNVAPYVVSKLAPFLFNKQTRGIVSCRKSTLDFGAAVRGRKIVLVNLAKGTIGNLAASFIGMLFTEKILRAAMLPANSARTGSNFYIYADEAQNITTPSFAELLSEARKYRLGAVLAHQYLGQLPANVLRAALGNAGNLVCMRVGPEDAEHMAAYFHPAFSKSDLLSLSVGEAAASALCSGVKPRPFLLTTSNGLALFTERSVPAYVDAEACVKQHARKKRPAKRSGAAAKRSRFHSTEGDVSL